MKMLSLLIHVLHTWAFLLPLLFFPPPAFELQHETEITLWFSASRQVWDGDRAAVPLVPSCWFCVNPLCKEFIGQLFGVSDEISEKSQPEPWAPLSRWICIVNFFFIMVAFIIKEVNSSTSSLVFYGSVIGFVSSSAVVLGFPYFPDTLHSFHLRYICSLVELLLCRQESGSSSADGASHACSFPSDLSQTQPSVSLTHFIIRWNLHLLMGGETGAWRCDFRVHDAR